MSLPSSGLENEQSKKPTCIRYEGKIILFNPEDGDYMFL
jgi:hypothetical protein